MPPYVHVRSQGTEKQRPLCDLAGTFQGLLFATCGELGRDVARSSAFYGQRARDITAKQARLPRSLRATCEGLMQHLFGASPTFGLPCSALCATFLRPVPPLLQPYKNSTTLISRTSQRLQQPCANQRDLLRPIPAPCSNFGGTCARPARI
jgi:hypothetical protein